MFEGTHDRQRRRRPRSCSPSREVAERTPFERTPADEQMTSAHPWGPPELALTVGWGPVWWYDPVVAPVTFVHPVITHERYPVFVRAPYHPPRRVYAPPPHRAYVVPPRRLPRRATGVSPILRRRLFSGARRYLGTT